MASHGALPEPGVVLVAPGDQHMRLGRAGRIALDSGAPMHSCRPAIDALFLSIAESPPPTAIGILLTGMGQDGAVGLLAMQRAGLRTIAQDEPSSTIYGMPKAAVEIGAAERVMSLTEIAAHLSALQVQREPA